LALCVSFNKFVKINKMKKQDILKGILIATLIVVAALTRMVDHPMNFAPMAAIILFSVSVIPNNFLKFVFPAVVIIFSDVLLQITTGFGFHSGTPHVYASFVLVGLIAFSKQRKTFICFDGFGYGFIVIFFNN
jgi:hypothetical protein